MTEITAEKVKMLRDMTGAGMMDCKKALTENGGDMDAAVDWLRKKGISQAAKKSGRVAADGAVGLYISGGKGVVVELNSETDFVAKNDKFQALALEITKTAFEKGENIETLKTTTLAGGKSVADSIVDLIAVIGENITLRRSKALSAPVVAGYVHSQIAPGLGKIGVLVGMDSTGDKEKLAAFGKQIAMHIAASKPEALNVADVDQAMLEREKAVIREQTAQSGKPENVIEKMVEGRIRKYYEEVVLNEQVFVIDGKSKVSDAVANFGKELGSDVKLTGFVRFAVGEGIQKEESDFASEVASMAKAG